MPLPSLGSVVRLAVVHQLHSQDIINTIHFQYPAPVNESQVAFLAEYAVEPWIANVLPFASYQEQFLRIEARQAVTGGGFAWDAFPEAATYGPITVDADNTALAVSIKLQGNKAGRSHNGRMFIGGIPNNVVQDGYLDTNYRNDLAEGIEAWIDLIDANVTGATPVIVSYFSGGEQRVTPVTTPIIHAKSVTRYPAHLSSRNRKGG